MSTYHHTLPSQKNGVSKVKAIFWSQNHFKTTKRLFYPFSKEVSPKIRRPLGHWRFWGSFLLNHRPKPLARGPLSFSSGGENRFSGPSFPECFHFVFWVYFWLSFLLPQSQKNDGFGRPKWLQKLNFSSSGGHWIQTLIFQSFFSILLPWALELLLRILNICSPKHCKNHGFLQVFVGFPPIARFCGWKQNSSFWAAQTLQKCFKNPWKPY